MTIWINEFHYDNSGGDVGEFIELAASVTTDLTGWSVVLYNGSNGTAYNTENLSGELTAGETLVLEFPTNGIQNGSPDGIALVDASDDVVEFISYEGSFTAIGGPADGLTSTNIGVSEPGSTPVGFSLQREGTGSEATDFTWATAAAETRGATNTGQTIVTDGPAPLPEAGTNTETMLSGLDGYDASALLTIGEQINGYVPVGVIDGLGAVALEDEGVVRVYANHELLHFRGSVYEVTDGDGGTFTLTGARISYFDIDMETRQIVDGGLAYDKIVDANGNYATDNTFLPETFAPFFGGPEDASQWQGFSRFCSSMLVEAEQFGDGRGLTDTIYFAGEEDGGGFNNVGGAEWALDIATNTIYQLPAFGRGAWENVTEIDSGSDDKVAFILADDSSPFDADGDGENEAAPLFLYVGEKVEGSEDFLARNGLSDGKLYVWVADNGDTVPSEFNGTGSERSGTWVEVDNSQNMELASEDGTTGYDEYGYPTQRTLWTQAEALGAFGFSRPEDVATNPIDGTEFVMASTGVDTFDNGSDQFGTMYTMTVDVENLTGDIRIAYDGDADPARALRSPDNLDWADDGYIYVQEDEAEEDTLDGEPLFGEGAVNPNEAGIVRLDPATGEIVRVANIDRSVVLDPTTDGAPVDGDAGSAGEWESSGILDVSTLFGETPGTLMIASVQAHGIEDQDDFNADSRINDGDLVEGGQLLFLSAPQPEIPPAPEGKEELVANVLGTIELDGAEIVAFDPGTMKAFVTSGDGLQVIDASDPSNPVLVDVLGGDSINSVAIGAGLIAIAVAADDRTEDGVVKFFDLETLEERGEVIVGPNPDDLKFDDTGTRLIVVNEGESSGEENEPDAEVNPEGSISIIKVNEKKPGNSAVIELDFTHPSITFDALEAIGVRVNRDAPSAAADLEPEYVTINGSTAYVSLQENNAIVSFDIFNPRKIKIDDFLPLGEKDHSDTSAGLDASNRDDAINIKPYDISGLYMADQIATINVDGVTYILTANEGDGRDVDESRGADLVDGDLSNGEIDTSEVSTTLQVQLGLDDQLGRLKFSNVDGDIDGDGLIEELHAFGGRSFSIYNAETGEQVFDSGDDFEQITALAVPELFNANDGDPDEFDDRSDDKGPEPESITVGEVDGTLYAFIALERTGGVMVYDITDPTDACFEQYIPLDGDVSPEGLQFISAEDSPTGQSLLAVASEESETLTFVSFRDLDVAIYDIQGEGHTANYLGEDVRTTGIVTAVDFSGGRGFYLQDASGDGNDATSDAIFVFTGSSPTVSVGDEVQVTGTVSEFTPGGSSSGNLSTSQIGSVSNIEVLSTANALPEAVIIGASGRVPPSENIDDDAFGEFDPANDGIDFFESLEAMRVTVEDAVAVSNTNRFGEIFTSANGGADATGISERGTLNISEDDFNPEKIQIDEDSGVFNFDFPEVNVGAELGDVTGVVGYGFGNFEVIVTEDFTGNIVDSDLEPEVTSIARAEGVFTFASYNVLNLDVVVEDSGNLLPGVFGGVDDDIGDGRFDAIAGHIAYNLGAPSVVALQEIQDNTGAEGVDSIISASNTLDALVQAIEDAGGPSYEWIDNTFITDDASGGIPGGNIRTAYLYDPETVSLVEDSVATIGGQSEGEAFEGGRLPLVATFEYGGEEFTFVNVHLSSKGGSAPILGVEQDFAARQEDTSVNGSLDERLVQAEAIADYVDGLENVIVLGDFNEFEFISPVEMIENAGLANLTNTLPDDEAYTFLFQGNSQSLDHILISEALAEGAEFDIVHVNSEFAETDGRASDHDPLVASILVDEFAFA